MKKACFAGSIVGNSKSYLVQPSIFVSQQYYGVANFSCCCDSSDSRSPGESGRGLKSNGAGDGAGCVFTSTWVLIQRVLHNPKNITYIHHQIYLSHTVHDYSRWKVIRDGKCQEFNSFPLSRFILNSSCNLTAWVKVIFWHFRINSGAAMAHENCQYGFSTVLCLH